MAEKPDVLNSLSYGVDFRARRIYFGCLLDSVEEDSGTFTQNSVELAVRAMHRMALDAPSKPIEIHMNSYGGDMCSMLRLYDEILTCPCQVKFFGGGAIMSAATWIMAVCDERYLHQHTTVMVHELSADQGYDKHTNLQVSADENRRIMEVACELYEKNSYMPKSFWLDICQRDVFLTAQETIALGLADKIIEPKKRGNLRKMRQAHLKKTPDKDQVQSLIKSIYQRIHRVNVPNIQVNAHVKEPVDPALIVDDSIVLPVEEGEPY
jgi:ATP-dependent protease ClpP protease subunit